MNEPRSTRAEEADDHGPTPVEGAAIAGRVTDFLGVPLAGVRVEAAVAGGGDLDLLPTLTNGEGRFRLEGLAEGAYDLRFEVGSVKARTLAVPAGTLDLDVQLSRPMGILLVVKVADGVPSPPLIHVVLERQGSKGVVREHTGRHLTRRMLLWSIRPGTYTVSVWGGALLPVRVAGVEVREDRGTPEVEVLLAVEGGSISGRVFDESGAPQEGALVGWRPLESAGPWPRSECAAETDERGRFRVRGLPAGRYLVSAGTERGAIVDTPVDVAESASTEIEIHLGV